MNRELVQWQIVDPETNCVFPWFTHGFLEVLKTWDLKNCNVLEYGGGNSTAYWRAVSNTVITIETKASYVDSILEECKEMGLGNGLVILKEVNEGDRDRQNQYVEAYYDYIVNFPYDLVVVDGIFRYECMLEGLLLLRKEGGRLIVDNWQQDGFVCPACEELMLPYKDFYHPFVQEDHIDNHGRKWCTAYWDIPKRPTDIWYGGDLQ